MMINDMPQNIRSNINIFADDSCLWESGLNLSEIISSLQASLNSISTWCKSWGVKISSEKSAVVVFTRRRKFASVCLKYNDTVIPVKREYKYLGITFDSRLSFNSHSNLVVTKCHKRLNFMRLLSGTRWGSDIQSLLRIYRTLVRPIIEYGYEIYLCAPSYVMERVQKLQNSALRICCGAMKTSPIIALQHFCNEYPIALRRFQSCIFYRCHILSLPNPPCKNLVSPTWHEIFPDSSSFCTFDMLTRSSIPQYISFTLRHPLAGPSWTYLPIPIDYTLANDPAYD